MRSEKYKAANEVQSLKAGSILENDRWSKGLVEMKYLFGLFAERYCVIEADKPAAYLKAVSNGSNAAFYSSKVTILANRKICPCQAPFLWA